jgi:WD40 repeat protein
MLSFDLVHPPDFQKYHRQVVIALSRVFYSSALISEVLQFILQEKAELVVEREIRCIGPSRALKIFKESNMLVSVGEIGVQQWDLSSFQELKHFDINPIFLCAVIFSDAKTVVVGNLTLDFWDTETEKMVRSIPCRRNTRMLALTKDEKLLAGANFFNKITIWNVESGELLTTLDSASGFPLIQFFTQDDSRLHVANYGDVYEMNAISGELKELYSDRNREVKVIKELPGSLLVTVNHQARKGSSDLEVWDFKRRKIKWSSVHNAEVSGIFNSRTFVISSGERESVKLWDIETGRLLSEYYGGQDRSFIKFEITPDRQKLIAATNAGLIMIFTLR